MFMVPRWSWMSVGDPYDAYPPRLRELRRMRVSGVYGIRLRTTGAVLYIGESHSDCLYQTLTRHLQKPHVDGRLRYFCVDRSSVEVDWTIMENKPEIMWLEAYLMAFYEPVGNGDRAGWISWDTAESFAHFQEDEPDDVAPTDEVPF